MMTFRPLAAIFLFALAMTGPAMGQEQTARVTFVLVNDIYQMSEQVMADGKARGGFARLAAVVNAERAKGPVIFAHAGDTLSPSLLSGIDRGEHIIALTNMIPPDIFVPGNHEFDFGKDNFLKRMSEAKFPLFAANIRMADGTPVAGFKDRTIVMIGGIRIGLTGATEEQAAILSNPGDLKFTSAEDTIKEQAAALRKEGADIVVAVVHTDRDTDEKLMRSRAADVILSGHDHDLYLNYDGRTVLVESSSDAHFVTAIDITITARANADGRREVVWRPQFRIIDTADVKPEPGVLALVRDYEKLLSKEMDVSLATTEVELDSRNPAVRTREAAIGNLFADALRTTTDSDIAVINGGGIRGDKIYPPGSAITRRDILGELVFGNKAAVLDISGKDLKEGLENGFSLLPRNAGRFPQVSGLKIEVDLSRPPNQRILSVSSDGVPLDDAKIYKLATNDFMARGGDGYSAFQNAKELIPGYDGPLMANEVMVYLRKLGTVSTGIEGRIVLR